MPEISELIDRFDTWLLPRKFDPSWTTPERKLLVKSWREASELLYLTPKDHGKISALNGMLYAFLCLELGPDCQVDISNGRLGPYVVIHTDSESESYSYKSITESIIEALEDNA